MENDKEKRRLKKLLKDAGVSDGRIKALEPVIENVSWMKIKLDQAREKIKSSAIVIPYDNGGGQTGIRENPAFRGYESLWKSYMSGMSKILEYMPPEIIETEKKEEENHAPATVLELVRSKHKKEA